ncbi:hypothetical protein QBC36DRAFT_287464 [Triangularia setosa]|uniref:Infection structure specific protein n=1 Tax=Triangularia setosa TaxID=2587417 RepID=A0AAN6WD61_9PEZI|nr:hypothetical protein QBC36DRAFT_287464 [Podospora setosa]
MKLITALPFFTLAAASPKLLQAQPRQEATATASATPTRTTSPCQQSYDSIIGTRPTQHPDIVPNMLDSFFAEQSGVSSLSDLRSQCSWAQNWSRTAVGDTPALQTAISSWNSAHSSWISEAKDEATKLAKSCATAFDDGDGGERIGILLALAATDVDECVTAQLVLNGELNVASLTMSATATPTEGPVQDDDETDGGDGEKNTTSTSTAGAAKETGYMMAAAAVGVAVAGVVGSL